MIALCILLSFCTLDTLNSNRSATAVSTTDSTISWEEIPQTTPFNSLWQTMDSVSNQGNGTISCLYIGGSHVQGGWIGHGLRERFERFFPGTMASRGWLLPYRMAQTDTPTHLRTEKTGQWSGFYCTKPSHQGPFGSTGLRAHTEDRNATWQHVSIPSDSTLHQTTAVEIWGEASGCIPSWIGHETASKRSVLTKGQGWRFEFKEPVDTVSFGLESNGKNGISFDLFATVRHFPPRERAQLILYEWGNNGAKISDVLRCEAWENDLPPLNLDLIILGLGLNDVHATGSSWDALLYEEMYSKLIQRIQGIAPDAVLLLLSNTDSMKTGKSMARESQMAHAIHRTMGTKFGCATFNLGQAMGPPGCILKWQDQGLAKPDLVHFTAAGYDVLAGLIFSSWIQAYKSYETSNSSPYLQHQ